jgi:hypothetical protein
MKQFLNTNPKFGDSGPFHAESVWDLANDANENFVVWAEELFQSQNDDDTRTVSDRLLEIQCEFISGLREIKKII